MVHTKCTCKYGRGNPSTEFYKNGKPQIYCMGWIDRMDDQPLECCKSCPDWNNGEQFYKDFDEWQAEISAGKKEVK